MRFLSQPEQRRKFELVSMIFVTNLCFIFVPDLSIQSSEGAQGGRSRLDHFHPWALSIWNIPERHIRDAQGSFPSLSNEHLQELEACRPVQRVVMTMMTMIMTMIMTMMMIMMMIMMMMMMMMMMRRIYMCGRGKRVGRSESAKGW